MVTGIPELIPMQIDGVVVSSPDGAYFKIGYDEVGQINAVQVIVIGPMRFAPIEYQIAVRERVTHELFDIASMEFLDTALLDTGVKKIVMQRGFVSMILERMSPQGNGAKPKPNLKVVEFPKEPA
jgi:hypothetical protein